MRKGKDGTTYHHAVLCPVKERGNVTDPLQKARALEAEHNKKPAKRENNRAKYPEIAEAVDRFREVFGEGVRVAKVWRKD